MDLLRRLALLVVAIAWPKGPARLAAQELDSGETCASPVQDSSGPTDAERSPEQPALSDPSEPAGVLRSASRGKAPASASPTAADAGEKRALPPCREGWISFPLTVYWAQPHLRTNGSADAGGRRT